MMKTKQVFYFTTIALAITFASCKKDDPEPEPETPTPSAYANGVFITNEGAFGTGTGTVSFFDKSNSTVSQDIFQAKNGYPLGNIVQSMNIHNGKGYIVVNNAGKVEIVDANTFASSGVITGLTNPRNFLGIDNNKGYISEWGAGGVVGAIKVVDLTTKAVTATIATGKGAEEMVKVGNNVYVTCSGGFSSDSVVTVIDATTNAVLTTINVGSNPKGIKVDINGKIWVLCTGEWNSTYTALVKTGKLVRIDASTNTVDLSLPFSSTTSQPSHLIINGTNDILYYMYNGKVYEHSITFASLNSLYLINRNFYALAKDPVTGYFYASDAGNFTSNGKIIRYQYTGMPIDSFTVGVIPGNFCFK